MNKTTEGTELVRMIESLGYQRPRELTNRVGNWLRKSEGWREKYVISSDGAIRLKDDAETLIDNLCILFPYDGVFPKCSHDGFREGNYPFGPRKYLADPAKRRELEGRLDEHRDRLRNDEAVARMALDRWAPFVAMLESERKIDITRDKIRDLLKSFSDKNPDALNFSNSWAMAHYEEISLQRRRIEDGEQGAEPYVAIGEAFFQLGDMDACLDAVEQALGLEPDNNRAWVLSCLANARLLQAAMTQLRELRAEMGADAPWEHPITAEEQVQGERFFEVAPEVQRLRQERLESLYRVLETWESWLMKTGADASKHQWEHEIRVADRSLRRNDVLAALVTEMTMSDFRAFDQEWPWDESRPIDPAKVLRFSRLLDTFRKDDGVGLPNVPFIDAREKAVFRRSLLLLMTGLGLKGADAMVEAVIAEISSPRYRPGEYDLAQLTDNELKPMFIRKMGGDAYLALYRSLTRLEATAREQALLRDMAHVMLDRACEALAPATGPLKRLQVFEIADLDGDNEDVAKIWEYLGDAASEILGWRKLVEQIIAPETYLEAAFNVVARNLEGLARFIEMLTDVSVQENAAALAGWVFERDDLLYSWVSHVRVFSPYLKLWFAKNDIPGLRERLDKLFADWDTRDEQRQLEEILQG